jgi:hypothetical protein
MVSAWSNPLPLEEYAAAKVVIYTYEGRWIPIMHSCLAEAIRSYHNAVLHGAEIFVFPSELAPWSSKPKLSIVEAN